MVGAIIAKREVRKAFHRINQRDLDAVIGMFTDDAVFEFPAGTFLGGRHEGREAVRAWFDRWFTRMASINFTLKHVAAAKPMAMGASNVVYAEWDLEETDKEGTTDRLTGITALYVEGGKAKLVKQYIFDQNVIAEIWSQENEQVR